MSKQMLAALLIVALSNCSAFAVDGVDGISIRPAQEAAKVKGCKIAKPAEYKVSEGDLIELDYTYPVVPGSIPKKVDYIVPVSGSIVKSTTGFRTVSIPGIVGAETIAFFFEVQTAGGGKITLDIDGEKYEYNFEDNITSKASDPKRIEWLKKRKAALTVPTAVAGGASAPLWGPGVSEDSPAANKDFYAGDAVNIEVPAGSKNGDYIFLMRIFITDPRGSVVAQNTKAYIAKMTGPKYTVALAFDVDVPGQKPDKYELKTRSSVIEPGQTVEKQLDEKKVDFIVK